MGIVFLLPILLPVIAVIIAWQIFAYSLLLATLGFVDLRLDLSSETFD